MGDFVCQKCGFCCQLDVKLEKEDIEKLREAEKKDFIKKIGEEFFLERPNNFCLFFKEGKCTIYNIRPGVCRRFPFKYDDKMSQKCKQKDDFSSKVVQNIVKFMNMRK